MVTLDRQSPPVLIDIEALNAPQANKISLDNGIPLYTINSGKKEIVKLELIFKAGKWYETGKLISKLTAKLMKDGTASRTSKQIAEYFDFFGTTFKIASNAELGSLTLYSLKKHLGEVLPLVREILSEASYPESEFEIKKNNYKQDLLIQLEKNEYLASRNFLNIMYGDDHPYGYMVEPEDYDSIDLDKVKDFYKKYYSAENCRIIASGLIDDTVTKLINQFLGNGMKHAGVEIEEPNHQPDAHPEKIHFVEKDKSVQSAIRIGMHLFNKTHTDHPKLKVVNTILGGYFGSRLMSNIREEKGYTYGIYSGVNSYLHSGHFQISTEVGHQLRKDTINEISKEILRLKNEPVPFEEFDMVRNYMISKVLRSLDGPFNLSNTYKKLWIYGLDENYLHNFVHEIRDIKPSEVMDLTSKYLSFEKMYQIAVG